MFKKVLPLFLVLAIVLSTCAALATSAAPDWTEYDKLIGEIKKTTDFAKRAEMMHQAEDILMGTGAIVPLYYYNDLYMMKKDIEGFYTNLYGFKFFAKVTKGDAKVLRVFLASEPDKLDPALNSSVDGACLAIASFGGLYTYDAAGKVVPNFATDHKMSVDGLTYDFNIRDGLKWSDGSPLTAKDFEYSWKRAAATETAADYSYMFNGIAGFPDNLEVKASEDGKVFTVKLAAPCAYFLDLAAFPAFFAVKQDQVENAKDYKKDGKVANPGAWALEAGFVSSGPFVLKSWKHNESMVYEKNPNYWDAANVKLESLEFMLSDSETTTYAAYQAGNLDFVDAVPQDEIQNLLNKNPEFHVVDQLGTYYAIFNVKSKLFDGKTVEQAVDMRKGLSALIDRQYIVDTIAQTGQKVATSFIPIGMVDGNGSVFKRADGWKYPVGDGYYPAEKDVKVAVELLKKAGYKFDDQNKLSAETPIKLEYLTNQTAGHVAIAEAMQQDFAEIGIEMTIKSIDWKVFLNERKAGNYDFARNGWIADFNDPINMLEMWITESGNNDAQFGR